MRHFVLSAVILLTISNSYATAGSWAKAMFGQLEHDFGSVPGGADVRHEFVVTNLYDVPVRISGLKRTCGCTLITLDGTAVLNAKITQTDNSKILKTLQPGERATIAVKLDTRNFLHRKSSQITVYFDQPRVAEVRLITRSFIRQDVVLNPGTIQFGTGTRRHLEPQQLDIEYAGRRDWQIVEVVSHNPALEITYDELYRRPGRIGYRLSVAVKPSTQAGTLRDTVLIHTNDPATREVPVLVEGQLLPELIITPSELKFGSIQPMQQTKRLVLIRGRKPFRILKVDGQDEQFEFEFSSRAQKLHTVRVEFKGSTDPGTYQRLFRIATDLPGEVVAQLNASVSVVH